MLKKSILGLAAGTLLLSAGSALAENYQFDKQGQHGFIEFRIQHLGYSWLYGSFKDFDGNFTYDAKDPAKDKVEVTIKTGSIDTNHAERDKHLRSPDFLNAAKFPEAKFVSTALKKEGDKYLVTGDFTLNGVTKPITLDAKLTGECKDPWGGYRAGFVAK